MTAACDRGPTINELFRRFRHWLRTVSADEDRVVAALTACRTATLGGSTRYCRDCEREHFMPHSCRNRHCPTCQHGAREKWVEARMEELLPVPYFHVVFTLPEDLRDLALRNKRVLYGLLMRVAWETLRDVGERRLAARLGAIAILHTWGQALWHHPHAHFVVPGGGIGADGRWRPSNPRYLLPVKRLKEVFRGKFLSALEQAWKRGELGFSGRCAELERPGYFAELLARCARKSWVVFAKRPFASPEAVLRYVGNYTHRVAISNRRIVRADEESVTFLWKDYADGGRQKEMTLRAEEFLRRFLLHVLPRGFVKIRFFGWMAHPVKKENLKRLREQFGAQPPRPRAEEKTMPHCPHCGSTRIVIVGVAPPIRRCDPASVRIDDTS